MSETDRELLMWAAKAAGEWPSPEPFEHVLNRWNPLADSGQALDLSVKLRLLCGFVQPNCWAELPGQYPSYEPYEPDPYAATRRAIVRAAAEIGRNMK